MYRASSVSDLPGRSRRLQNAILPALMLCVATAAVAQITPAPQPSGGMLDDIPAVPSAGVVKSRPAPVPAAGPLPASRPTPPAAAPAQPPLPGGPQPISQPPAAPAAAPTRPVAVAVPTPAPPQVIPAPSATSQPAPAASPSPPAAQVTPATTDANASSGLLDDIPDKPGVITMVRPVPPAPTLSPAAPSPVPATPTPTPPPAQGAPTPTASPGVVFSSYGDAMANIVGQGIYVTPPAAGTPDATALDEIALLCQKPAAEVRKAMSLVERTPSLRKQNLVSADGSEKGQFFEITVPALARPLPAALACLSSGAPGKPFGLDLLVDGREFGPLTARLVLAGDVAQIGQELNALFGSTGQPWRLASANELLGIILVLYEENLWGPNGAKYWTADGIADGSRLAVDAKSEPQSYRARLIAVDAAAKALPVWVRDRVN